MQDIVFYAAANETLGVVRDYANSRNEYAPTLVLGVSVCLRMRLFAGSESADPYPLTSFSGITRWKWCMDSDFDRETPYKLTADSNGISVQTVTDTIDGETMSFTEFAIQISDMNTQELAAWLGTEKKKTGLTGELVGYDSSENAVFVLQIDDFTVRNRLAGLGEPTSNDREYLTRSETENLVSSSVAAKQDKLTSANAGAGIAIDSGGTISMACVILGATNGVMISDGIAQFDVTTAPVRGGTTTGVLVDVSDGLLVNGGTASIDDASVQDTLSGIVAGSTASINDEVVTPGSLRGALSIGQAVDVSCKPYNNSGSISCTNDDFLQGFTCSMVSGTTVGFYDASTHTFPKFAEDLVYLFIADVSGSGTITPNGGSAVTLSGTPQRIAMKVTAKDTGYFSASSTATVNVANWRQYEVTALTDEAMDHLASLPTPDAFFRSTSTSSVVNKYLIKQDMVCPWIKTIAMPDNSALTVAAGLSYRIKYTNDNAHLVTVDTIPADAYGWDAHIQMFVKGASSVQFRPPLILMDALTPNAGHNLSVKFRNGQALVYVDDLNAGYIVVSPTGSADGTLAYGLTMTPDNAADDKYIIFGSTVNSLVCDFGTVTAVYGAQSTAINAIGNGMDQTTITGTLTIPAGKYVNLQDLTITGSTVDTTGNSSWLRMTNVKFTGYNKFVPYRCVFDGCVIPTGSTVYSNPLNGNIYNGLTVNGVLLTSGSQAGLTIYGDGNGLIRPYSDAAGIRFSRVNHDAVVAVSGVTITGFTAGSGGGFFIAGGELRLTDCVVAGNRGGNDNYPGDISFNTDPDNRGTAFITASTIGAIGAPTGYGSLYVTDSVIDKGTFYRSTVTAEFSGTNKIITWFKETGTPNPMVLTVTDHSVLDLSSSGSYLCVSTMNLGCSIVLNGADGRTARLDNCTITGGTINSGCTLIFTELKAVDTAAGTWTAENLTLKGPVKADNVRTVKLSGNTFSGASKIAGPPARIQLPAAASAKNSFEGNTNSASTPVLQAAVIVAGDNAASPSGSAFVVISAGSTSSYSGIGTCINRNGSNDFTAISNVKSVTVSSGASTVASSLAGALALTTSSGGVNRWVKLANNLTASATMTSGITVADKRIITAEYEPVLAGNFSFSSGAVVTVDEATRTTTIASAAMVMSNVELPSGATVRVSGGSLAIDCVNGAGGTIELAGSNAFRMTSGTIGRVVISSGAIVNLTSSIVPGAGIALYGGASLSPTTIVCGGSSRIFEDVEIRGATITDQGIIYGATVYSDVGDDHYIYSTGDDGATSSSVIVTGATEYVVPGGLVRIVGT